MRLIDAEPMIEALEKEKARDDCRGLWYSTVCSMLKLIKSRPVIEVKEQKRGKWKHIIDKDWSGGELYRCSCCNYGYAIGAYHEPYEFQFCPNCGADMRGSDK